MLSTKLICRTPRECVDWNKWFWNLYSRRFWSHSSRVRGLKYYAVHLWIVRCWSHSSRVRGLKSSVVKYIMRGFASRTPRECVDWNDDEKDRYYIGTPVALLASAWIEIDKEFEELSNQLCRTPRECVDWNQHHRKQRKIWKMSHSSRVRGLKYYLHQL